MKVISEEILTKIADALRAKAGLKDKLTPPQFVDVIGGIETVGEPVSKTVSSTSTNATTITFTGLTKKPTIFSLTLCSQYTTASRYVVTSCAFDGSKIYNTTRYSRSSGTDYTYVGTGFSWTYNNGTLQIKSPSNNSSGGVFCGGTYRLIAL
ncbi:MAG: hypothetical protein MJZ96_01590 [Paludibacteraceae bacterium]|nr:hypothetical protein [Paludibacteraceae bacterium]